MKLTDEFYEMIKDADGESTVVADIISEELNAAIAKYENSQENKKRKDADALADHFRTFAEMYYPNITAGFEGSELIEMCDNVNKIFSGDFNLDKIFNELFGNLERKDEKNSKKTKTLSQMITDMGW